jgi:hypothetical protein
MTDTATQTGVEEVKPLPNPRNAILDQIAAQHDEKQKGEFSSFNEETGEILPDEPAEPEVEVKAEEPPPKEEPPADDETIVVDGREQKVSKDKIYEAGRRALQKESAADKRLEEATRLFKEAQRQIESLKANPSSDDTFSGSHAPSDQDAQPAMPDIDSLLDQKLYMRDAQSAAKRFQTEFADVMTNPVFATWVAVKEDERIKQAMADGLPLGDPWEAYSRHGIDAREQMQKLSGVAPSNDKLERKRESTVVKGAAVRAPAPVEDKPESHADIIANIRKSRGQRI